MLRQRFLVIGHRILEHRLGLFTPGEIDCSKTWLIEVVE